jgi:hypothetical protein
MMRTSLVSIPFVAAFALALPACATNVDRPGDSAAEPDTQQVSEAITNGQSYSFSTFTGPGGGGSTPPNIPTSNTCFLTSVVGQLYGVPQGQGFFSRASVGVAIDPLQNAWYATTVNGGGNGVGLALRCIPYAANRVFASSNPSAVGYNVVTIPNTPNRQCFLTSVSSSNGLRNTSNYVMLRAPGDPAGDPTNWQLVTQLDTVRDQNGYLKAGGAATAVCVDVPIPRYGLVSWQGATPLHFTPETNIECGLTSVAGNYSTAGTNGVSVFPDGSGWNVLASTGKALVTMCAK